MKKWTSFPGVVSTAISWQRRAGSRASNPLSVRHFFFFLRLSPRPPVTNGVAFRLSRHRRVRQQFQHLEIEKALVRHRFGGDAGPVTKASGLFPCCDVDVTRRPPKNQRSFRKKKTPDHFRFRYFSEPLPVGIVPGFRSSSARFPTVSAKYTLPNTVGRKIDSLRFGEAKRNTMRRDF